MGPNLGHVLSDYNGLSNTIAIYRVLATNTTVLSVNFNDFEIAKGDAYHFVV